MKVVQYLGGAGSWGDVCPETMNEKGLGGRESALVHLSRNWADFGHEVINFVPTSKTHVYEVGDGEERYVASQKAGAFLKDFGADVVVSWEEPRLFGVPEIVEAVGLKIIEMQVANMTTTAELDANTDYYAVLSRWAGEYLCQQDEDINPEKLVVFPNGVDINRFPSPQFGRRNPDDRLEFYYSSSPDRGLNHLLNMWPKIRSEFPGALLHVAYGVEHWLDAVKWNHNMQAEAALDVLEGLQQEGVIYHGRIGQDRLATIQRACDALLYPCDTMQPTETGCITVVEAGAACSPAIITDCDCLPSEFDRMAAFSTLPLDYDDYIDQIHRVLEDPVLYEHMQHEGRKLAESRHWPLIALQWEQFFRSKVPVAA